MLYDNILTGSLPSQVGWMTPLLGLLFMSNALTGSIPSEVMLLSSLQDIMLQDNAFSGTIPNRFGLIGIGARLFLHSNSFSGSTPSELGLLTNMMGLDLDANALSGTIPKEIKEMTGLLYFDLSDLPLLDGTIPFGFGSRSQNGYFNVSSSGLSGTMPLEVCNLINSSSCADTTMGQWEINCTLDASPTNPIACIA